MALRIWDRRGRRRRCPAGAWAGLAALLMGLGAAVPARADEGWIIERFHSAIDVDPSGLLRVVEAIDVDFRGLRRHGLFRDVPFLLEFDRGHLRRYPIKLVGAATGEGGRLPVKVSEEGALERFRIGDPDRTVTGRNRYRLAYTVRDALNGFSDHDELYWNATGAWPVPVEAASVVVTVPAGSLQRVGCFEGPKGSDAPCRAEFDGNRARFSATRPLAAGDQVTIVAAMRKGAVAAPAPRLERKPRTGLLELFDLTPALVSVAALGLAAAVGGVGALWWRAGRDRRFVSLHTLSQTSAEETVPLFASDPIVVEFEPPDRLRPAEVGLLLDERADRLDVTATIIDLAVRGYLTIHEVPKTWWLGAADWRLERLKPADSNLLDYERIILDGLFEGQASRTVSALKNRFYKDLARANTALYDDAVARGWFGRSPERVRTAYRVGGVVALAAGIALAVWLGRHWGAGLLGLPLAAGGALLAAVARAMPRRTALGREMLRRSLGFARYIRTAEQRQQEFAERATIFSEYLPYAIVFKCVGRWARAFKDLDAQGAAAWYRGGSGFDAPGFSSRLGSFSSAVSTAIASTPGGSGGSGLSGGSAGGGGGGGGGGSW